MQRRFQVHPDTQIATAEGPLGVVSQQALLQAMAEAAVMLDRMGGVVTVVVGRHPTDLAGEMLTTGAVVEWKDRTDAKAAPETQQRVTTEPSAEPGGSLPSGDKEGLARAAQHPIGDGLDDPEAEVDESSVPPALQE